MSDEDHDAQPDPIFPAELVDRWVSEALEAAGSDEELATEMVGERMTAYLRTVRSGPARAELDEYARRLHSPLLELRGARGRVTVAYRVFDLVLEMAWRCGWEPAGTVGAGRPAWDYTADGVRVWPNVPYIDFSGEPVGVSDYLTGDGQTVTEADALALADALDEVLRRWKGGRISELWKFAYYRLRGVPVPRRKDVVRLAAFCRSGAFELHVPDTFRVRRRAGAEKNLRNVP